MDMYGEFEWRGLIYDATEGTRELLAREKVTGYIGFDPTASSLHVGNLLVMMALARLQRAGHSPIALVGGGTGLIGDPKPTAERALLTSDQVAQNVAGIRAQLEPFLDFTSKTAPARLVDNAEWLTTITAIELLRDVGKHFTVNHMMAKESVKRRLASEEGISFTEFSYLLLQAYDFVMLYDRFHCTLQMGGSDQWGNITAGVDLARRIRGAKVHGLVLPLVMTASGTKFGKTEAGTIWLDPARTSPYEFYQYWLNTDDRDAVRYLKFFTFLDQARIKELEAASAREPDQRHAQRELAREVTRLVHGDPAVREAESSAEKLFKGDLLGMSEAELLEVFGSVPSSQTAYLADGWPITEFLAAHAVVGSKSEAARLIRGGGLSVNGRRISDEKARLRPEDAIHGHYFVVRKGKKDNFLVRVLGD
ncbi:MAG TPA: tyrosine--tRNA ligase [Vicinamibacterales bacterium]|nr:tyrosine--tRNA ligase [Vicinamibacterales bacterium]